MVEMEVLEDTYNVWLIMDQVLEMCYFSALLFRIACQGPAYNQKMQ